MGVWEYHVQGLKTFFRMQTRETLRDSLITVKDKTIGAKRVFFPHDKIIKTCHFQRCSAHIFTTTRFWVSSHSAFILELCATSPASVKIAKISLSQNLKILRSEKHSSADIKQYLTIFCQMKIEWAS